MAEDWARRQQAARERWVEVGGFSYKIRRPTELEFLRLLRDGDAVEQLGIHCVVDWRRVTEADLAPGVGGEDAVPFSAPAYFEWISDRSEDLRDLANAVLGEVKARREAKAGIAGKSSST
jgi:hypothetical protein